MDSFLKSYALIPIILAFVLIIIFIVSTKIYNTFIEYILSGIKALKSMVNGTGVGGATGNKELDKAIENAGYSYDLKQDIFYSSMNAWQRNLGYWRLYDEAAAPSGMIIDCEPIYFEYDGKKWLIEFWKGQYDLTTGCEIGVYTTAGPYLNINGVINGTFYNCASNADRLQMSLVLKKNGKTLFTRQDKHWWLTGFKLGEFSEPSELTIDLVVTLKDEVMRNSFLKGLKRAGYLESDITINGNVVGLVFNKARTPQPNSRTTETDWIIQKANKLSCDKYIYITKPYDNLPDKINAIHEQAPDIYGEIMNIGRGKQIFNYKKN